jgi:excisionase family DNA binding protein
MKQHISVEELAVIQAKATLTVAEAAVVAGVCVGTLYKRWREGTGPVSFLVGKSRRVRRADLDLWMKALTKQAK